ncbi:MAG: DUF4932 domain-containing protein [Lachnospiraceae bacterium]|nr:DUF4932 domain-containing protein [Lachnospiraceae bacterium]
MQAEINKQVELVQVLLYLADEQEHTVQYLENKIYSKSISDWFKSYKAHAAVKTTKKLITENNFFHIRPLRAVLDMKNILQDDLHEFNLWAEETVRFAEESRFDDFFGTQNNYYAGILDYVNSCDFDTWIAYIENYFKSKPDEFHLIICPIAGNYGFGILHGEKKIAYTVRCMPRYDKNGKPDNRFDFFAMGIAHEYAHCFVNPIVEGNTELLKNHVQFFESHKNMPKSYNTDYAVMNEYLVRAFQIRFMEENRRLFPEFDISAEYKRQRESFIFIDKFIALLKEFEKSELQFPEFYTKNIERIIDGIVGKDGKQIIAQI